MNHQRFLGLYLSSLTAMDPKPWSNMGQSTLEHLRASVVASSRVARRWAFVVGAVVFIAMAIGFAWMLGVYPAQPATDSAGGSDAVAITLLSLAAGAGLCFAFAAAAGMMAYLGFGGLDARSMSRALAPLGDDPVACAEAVDWLQYPSVRVYRDQVVAQPRELVMGDFLLMNRLALRYRAATAQSRSRENCQTLHGIGQGASTGA